MRLKYSHENITMTFTQTIYPNCIAHRVVKKGVHSAKVGVRAPVFEKSVTEFKQKQKLLNIKE